MADGTLSAGQVSLAVKPDTSTFAGELKGKILGGISGVGEGMGGAILGGLKTMAGPIAAVAAGFGVEKLVEGSIKSFETFAGTVKTMQRISGGSVEEVSGLAGAMKLAGVDASNVTGAITIFSKKLGTAGQDAKATAAMNNLFGESIKDANGHVKSMAELLPGLADRFKDMPNGAEKTALATQLFGRSGAQLIPVLNKGSEGIAELTDKAKQMGLTLDESAMAKFNESKKASREFAATMEGLQITLGQAFLPVLEAVQNAFRDFLIPLITKATGFVKAHQKQFDDLANTIKGALMPIVSTLLDTIGNLTKWILQNKDVLLALGVAVLAGVIAFKAYEAVTAAITIAQKGWLALQAIFKIVTGEATLAQMGFNTALLANPIGLVIAAVVALIAGLVWFFTQTEVGKKAWSSFTSFLSDAWKNTVKALTDGWNGLVSFLSDSWKNIQKFFGVALQFILDLFLNWTVWGLVIKNWGAIQKFLETSLTAIGKFFGDIFKGISDAIGNAFDNAVSTVRGAINSIIGLANGAIGAINSVLSAASKITGGAVNIKVPTIPKLAEGGIIPATPGGRLVRVAEAGQAEAVIPLSKLGSMGGTGKGNTINYYAAPNDSLDAEQKLVSAVQRAKVLGAL